MKVHTNQYDIHTQTCSNSEPFSHYIYILPGNPYTSAIRERFMEREVLFACLFLFFWGRVSLQVPGCLGTHYYTRMPWTPRNLLPFLSNARIKCVLWIFLMWIQDISRKDRKEKLLPIKILLGLLCSMLYLDFQDIYNQARKNIYYHGDILGITYCKSLY